MSCLHCGHGIDAHEDGPCTGLGSLCGCNTFVRPEPGAAGPPSTKLAGIVSANYARSMVPYQSSLENIHLNHEVFVREAIRKAFFEGVRAAADLSAARQQWPDDPGHGKGGYHDNRRR